MNSKYCFQCGKPISPSAKFCPYCGAKQPESPAASKDNNQPETHKAVKKPIQNADQAGDKNEKPGPKAGAASTSPEPKFSRAGVGEEGRKSKKKLVISLVAGIIVLAAIIVGGLFGLGVVNQDPAYTPANSLTMDEISGTWKKVGAQSDEEMAQQLSLSGAKVQAGSVSFEPRYSIVSKGMVTFMDGSKKQGITCCLVKRRIHGIQRVLLEVKAGNNMAFYQRKGK